MTAVEDLVGLVRADCVVESIILAENVAGPNVRTIPSIAENPPNALADGLYLFVTQVGMSGITTSGEPLEGILLATGADVCFQTWAHTTPTVNPGWAAERSWCKPAVPVDPRRRSFQRSG